MKSYFKYLLFLFMVIECQQNLNSYSRNNACVFFDPNKPCWCPSGQAKNNYRLNESDACRADNLPKTNFDKQKIDQYILLNDLSVEEEQDFKNRAENNELTIEELKILDSIIIDKQKEMVDEGPICRKKGCPYFKCYRRKNCTCC